MTYIQQEEPINVKYTDICIAQVNIAKGILYTKSPYIADRPFSKYQKFQEELENIIRIYFHDQNIIYYIIYN